MKYQVQRPVTLVTVVVCSETAVIARNNSYNVGQQGSSAAVRTDTVKIVISETTERARYNCNNVEQ